MSSYVKSVDVIDMSPWFMDSDNVYQAKFHVEFINLLGDLLEIEFNWEMKYIDVSQDELLIYISDQFDKCENIIHENVLHKVRMITGIVLESVVSE